jgi:hypothetical protein
MLEPADTARVVALVAKFLRTVEQQRARDTELIAGLERVLRRGGPDVERLCELINHRGAHAYAEGGLSCGTTNSDHVTRR